MPRRRKASTREKMHTRLIRVKEIENNMMAAAEDNADGRDDKKLTSEQKAAKKAETAAKQKAARAAFLQAITEAGKSLRHTTESLLTKMFYMEEILTVM